MHIEFSTNASVLNRACVRLAARLANPVRDETHIRFKVTSGKLGISVEEASVNLMADVETAGTAFVPYGVLAGVMYMLPYFGNEPVEIGFSSGKMRVDTTVFHTRRILVVTSDRLKQRHASFSQGFLRTA